jgi:hypothetical protein
MRKSLLLAAAGLSLVLSTYASQAQSNLSQQQLRTLFPGNFVAVVKGYTVHFQASGGGALIGTANGMTDHGRWSVRNGQLCIAMANWTHGVAQCSELVADNGWYLGQGVKFRKA